jgi:hypothetical protein
VNEQYISPAVSRLRFIALVIAVIFFIWLPREDDNTLWVVFFALSLSAWIAARFLLKIRASQKPRVLVYGFVGLLAGLLISPLALMVVAIKNGIHSHEFPDFSLAQIWEIVSLTPYYLAAGLIIGLILSLWSGKKEDIRI